MEQMTINRLVALALLCLAVAVGCLLGFFLDNEETTTRGATTQGRPILVCYENEVAVWDDYPVSYRCIHETDHGEHDRG